MSKIALITGITGQDGSYLAELLLKKGYIVHGMIRRSSLFNTSRIDHIINSIEYENRFFLHYGDMIDSSSINRLLDKIQPEEIYNLAAQSHVQISFEIPDYTAQVDALGTLRILDALRETNAKHVKFYQASTSELYGKVREVPQTEDTPFYPRSPYAVAKLYSYWIIVNYREAYGLKAYNGILFNHESPRRGKNFITRKVTTNVARIVLGKQRTLKIGNIESKRDWGYAPEYCEGMWKIVQHDVPQDFVLSTNETHSVREFIEQSFDYYGLKLKWTGSGVNEKGKIIDVDQSKFSNVLHSLPLKTINDRINDLKNNDSIIQIATEYYRPTEVDLLIGDYSKAKRLLNWEPNIRFKELVHLMTESDLQNEINGLKTTY